MLKTILRFIFACLICPFVLLFTLLDWLIDEDDGYFEPIGAFSRWLNWLTFGMFGE